MKFLNVFTTILCSQSVFRVPSILKRCKKNTKRSQQESKLKTENCRLFIFTNGASLLYKGGENEKKFKENETIINLKLNKEDQETKETVCKELFEFYNNMKTNIMNMLISPYEHLRSLSDRMLYDIIYTGTIQLINKNTEVEYNKARISIENVILLRHRFINKKCTLKYIGGLFSSPSKMDLITFIKFPELIGMFICLVNKFNQLRTKDIILVLIHYNAIKVGIEQNKRRESDEKFAEIEDDLYRHVVEIFGMLNNNNKLFIIEYNKSLKIVEDKFAPYNVDSLIVSFRMILFMIELDRINTIKEFIEDSKIFTSLDTFETQRNNECLVCFSVGQIVKMTFEIIFKTLTQLNRASFEDSNYIILKKYNYIYTCFTCDNPTNTHFIDTHEVSSAVYDILRTKVGY
ncbi:hypothetical protein NGRA_0558 [Nosema granulosis]|uniref:Uncharacterized protein n=1 Tax=Nosema granulosis TaxID=83296 RepID=A0A9P6L0F2_9MICR|nr:hypothetical protein NGRA_0558 [Nosema granulosis]